MGETREGGLNQDMIYLRSTEAPRKWVGLPFLFLCKFYLGDAMHFMDFHFMRIRPRKDTRSIYKPSKTNIGPSMDTF